MVSARLIVWISSINFDIISSFIGCMELVSIPLRIFSFSLSFSAASPPSNAWVSTFYNCLACSSASCSGLRDSLGFE